MWLLLSGHWLTTVPKDTNAQKETATPHGDPSIGANKVFHGGATKGKAGVTGALVIRALTR